MNYLRLLGVVLILSLSPAAFAQSDAHEHAANQPAPKSDAQKPAAPKSDAQKAFDTLKTLAGTWSAKMTLDPPMPNLENNKLPGQISMRVTSRGNALVHEMYSLGVPDDPTKYDHPVTMLYLDTDRLTLVHYCDAGNRPKMVARPSADGKRVEFDFVDISGGNQYGHMHHAVFTVIDANHHTEDWIYMMPGDKPMHAHFDLHRANAGSGTSGQ
jgi:hypothetical protein